MPYIINREQAIEQINKTIKKGECIVCRILELNEHRVLHKGAHTTIRLSEYPRTWGQTMVMLNAHKTSITEITNEEWLELSENVRKTAIMLEKSVNPIRCYIASIGAAENLPNTCPHIHFNVLPIYSPDDKPTDIFSWRDGLCAANENEWEALSYKLKENWNTINVNTLF